MSWITTEAKRLEERLIQTRRDLHRIPEIGESLPKTRAYVTKRLDELNIEYTLNSKDDGIIAKIYGKGKGKALLLRADMDAVHGDESTVVDYASTIAGCMHGCGHDAHVATLLIVAEILKANTDRFSGEARLVFQTAEECSTGAKIMMQEGAIDGVSAALCLHVGNLTGSATPTGTLVIKDGYVSAGKSRFEITVHGKATHSAFPEQGVDSLLIAARIVNACEELSAREIAMGKAAVLSFGHLVAGEDHNTIPGTAFIEGSIRCHDVSVRSYLLERLNQICNGICSAFRASCEIKSWTSSDSVHNDPAMARLMREAVGEELGEDCVIADTPNALMGSDDFNLYAKAVPSVYFFLHTNNPEKGITAMNHSPYFNLDEEHLYKGVAAYVATAIKFLK